MRASYDRPPRPHPTTARPCPGTTSTAHRCVRAGRRASALPRKESRLLSKINQPFAGQLRYDELIAKRRTDALSQIEYAELLALTQQNEAFAVQHVRSLSELASLRQITLTDLMQQLGIQKLPYAN